MEGKIVLEHGAGGRLMHELIKEISARLNAPKRGVDKAVLKIPGGKIAFTTDSFVMKPPVIKGCDVGMLSVNGTVNDLVTMGAKPEHLSLSLIIEEGLEKSFVTSIIESIRKAADKAGVKIVTGDIKVVEKGGCDKVFINTSGIGRVYEGVESSTLNAKPGDAVIVTGSIGDHGAAVLAARGEFQLEVDVSSDCAPLTSVLETLVKRKIPFHTLIDPTRGGLASSLNEVAESSHVVIEVEEETIPVKEEVQGFCEVLGIEPFYLGCEGRLVIFIQQDYADKAIRVLRNLEVSKDSCIIGRVLRRSKKGEVMIKTRAGGLRNLPMLQGIPLPRIC
ncbi:MAG: hydrogenase expression/formation protein HypE [Crenarchaeota archaeon]|nr:hydrogenase expression/formation protein HypE [Thermoproteota archaeon]MDW8033649.1 hydrogenase expression/formation protein HypE [Nitrososphaerota archaeon]